MSGNDEDLMKQARDALVEAELQIEYLHDRFEPTKSGHNVLAKIDMALTALRYRLGDLQPIDPDPDYDDQGNLKAGCNHTISDGED